MAPGIHTVRLACPCQLWQEARVATAHCHAHATGQPFATHSKDLQSFLWTCAKVSHRLNLPKCGWWQCKKSCMKGIHTGVDSDPKMIKHVHYTGHESLGKWTKIRSCDSLTFPRWDQLLGRNRYLVPGRTYRNEHGISYDFTFRLY